MTGDPRPVALVTSTVTDYRREPFRMLDAAEDLEVLAYDEGGQLAPARAIARGRYRAVIQGLGGRAALPAGYAAARRARVPWILWASIWAHPRTTAHTLSYLPTRALYRAADSIVTYGPHVTSYIGRSRNVFEATQAVGPEFGREVQPAPRGAGFRALFVGRLEREKGVEVLLEAWERTALEDAELVFAGRGPLEVPGALGHVRREELPALYASADVLVLPSVPTATFREPWGLVVNEAMMQGTPVITSDAVGAAAGGLVRHERNGLVVPAGKAEPLAGALRLMAQNPEFRARMGANARNDVGPYTYDSWVLGMRRSLAAVGVGRP